MLKIQKKEEPKDGEGEDALNAIRIFGPWKNGMEKGGNDMTNKIAIEYLKDMLASAEANLHVPDMAEHAEALDMAIDALQRGFENVNADSCSEEPNRSDLVKESGDLVKDLVNDCISRQDIEWHDFFIADGNGMYHNELVAYKSQIDDLPSAQPQKELVAEIKVDTDEIMEWIEQEWYKPNEWIPCSERLPEKNGVYIVSYEDAVTWLEWFNGKWFFYPSNPAREETGTIYAWMPLPEPFRQSTKEK